MAGAAATTCGCLASLSINGRQLRRPSLWMRSKLMCEVEPSRRSCRSCRNPLFIASAMTSDATPAATPAMEMAVMIPMKACRRFARRYRLAMKSSKRIRRWLSTTRRIIRSIVVPLFRSHLLVRPGRLDAGHASVRDQLAHVLVVMHDDAQEHSIHRRRTAEHGHFSLEVLRGFRLVGRFNYFQRALKPTDHVRFRGNAG